jgi:hypothetical protein
MRRYLCRKDATAHVINDRHDRRKHQSSGKRCGEEEEADVLESESACDSADQD